MLRVFIALLFLPSFAFAGSVSPYPTGEFQACAEPLYDVSEFAAMVDPGQDVNELYVLHVALREQICGPADEIGRVITQHIESNMVGKYRRFVDELFFADKWRQTGEYAQEHTFVVNVSWALPPQGYLWPPHTSVVIDRPPSTHYPPVTWWRPPGKPRPPEGPITPTPVPAPASALLLLSALALLKMRDGR